MAGGALMGAATKAFAIWMQHKNESHRRTLELLSGREESIKAAREYDTPGSRFGRRFITIMSFCLLAFLVVSPAFLDITTNVPVDSIWPWIKTEYIELKGMVAYDVLMEILVATTSFYMGSATMTPR
jgi:hypothetical protein